MNQTPQNPTPGRRPARAQSAPPALERRSFLVHSLGHFVGATVACSVLERETEFALSAGDRLSNTLFVGSRSSGRTLLACAFVRDAGEEPVVCDASMATMANHLMAMVGVATKTRTLVLRNIDMLPKAGQADLSRLLVTGVLPAEALNSIVETLEWPLAAESVETSEFLAACLARVKRRPLRVIATVENLQKLIAPLRSAFVTTIQLPAVTTSICRAILAREAPEQSARFRPAQRLRIARILLALPDSRTVLLRALRLHASGETPDVMLHDFTHRILPTLVPHKDAECALSAALATPTSNRVLIKDLARVLGPHDTRPSPEPHSADDPPV
ncbi:MAG: hypothetical protein EXS03_09725 [Phycisphaerales bacterium]|nr:hypothetical protein [Phycisphaerales bacterium]